MLIMKGKTGIIKKVKIELEKNATSYINPNKTIFILSYKSDYTNLPWLDDSQLKGISVPI